MGAFFEEQFKKEHFVCLHWPSKPMLFWAISNENIVFKTQGTRLGAIVVPKIDLE